jgi:hypothetical protein
MPSAPMDVPCDGLRPASQVPFHSGSRARRRVQGSATAPDAPPRRQREVVDAFLAASRGGDFAALLTLLDPDVVDDLV